MAGMQPRVVERAIVCGSFVALVVVPLLIVMVQFFLGEIQPIEIFGGAAFAVAYFSSTAVLTVIFQKSAALPKAVMIAYVIKTAAVFALLYFVAFDNVSRYTLAASITFASLAYLSVQTVLIAGRARLLALGGPRRIRA
jgi:hypothetical protein